MTNNIIPTFEQLERRVLWSAGDLDLTFGAGGMVRDNAAGYAGGPDGSRDIAVDAAGRIVALGTITGGSEYGPVLRRYLADGSIDTSFGGGDGKVLLSEDDVAYSVQIQGDGKIVVAGQRTTRTTHGVPTSDPATWTTTRLNVGVYRFNADGSADTSFGGGDGIATADFGDFDEGLALQILGDGKIVALGSTRETHNGGAIPAHWNDDGTGVSTTQIALIRFNADGTLDNSFSGDGKLTHRIGSTATYGSDLAVQSDGKVVVAGKTIVYGGVNTNRAALVRFNANGAVDTSFGGGGNVLGPSGAHGHGYNTVALDGLGRILAGGDEDGAIVARHNANGALDTTFGSAGIARAAHGGQVAGIAVDADGNILAAGSYDYPHQVGVVRFTSGGAVDTSFGAGGTGNAFVSITDARANSIALQSDGKIVVGAEMPNTSDSDFLLARFQGGAGHQPVLTGNTISAPGQSASSTTEPVMFILAEGGPTPSTWTAVYDRANIIVTRKDTGAAYQLPGVKPHGSVNITGSEGPDIITAERVSAVGPLDPNLFQFVYFQTTATTGMVGVSANFVDPVKFQKHIDQTKSNLADAEARLAVSIAEHDPESVTASFREEVNHGKHLVKVAEATLEAMKTTTAFIRYRIDGVYDVYVAISDNMTSKTRIRIDAAGGNDVVAISNNVPLKATLAGGWGADKLTSGKRRSILYGGGGGDRLFSRSRVGGTLDGGKGADKYYTRFSECEVLARNDGDALIINDVPVKVTQCGIFGITGATATGPGKCYYLVAGDEGQTDLLA